jgi:hypothetical protein
MVPAHLLDHRRPTGVRTGRARLLLALVVLIGSSTLLACGSGGDREADEYVAAVRAWPEIADVRLHFGAGTISQDPFLSGQVAIRSDTPPERVPAVVARMAERLPFADVADLTGEVLVSVEGTRVEPPGDRFVLGFHARPDPGEVEAEARLWERFRTALPGTTVDMDGYPDGSHVRTVRVPTTSDAVPAALREAFAALASTDRPPTREARLELRVDGASDPSYVSGLDLPPEPVRRAMLAVAGLRAASPDPGGRTEVGWTTGKCRAPYLYAAVDASPDEVQPPGAQPGGAYVAALAAAGVPYLFTATDGADQPFVEVDKSCPR